MKRLLILSLLMVQGVWGAEADGGAPVQEAQRSVNVTTSDRGSFTYQAPGWSNTINNLLEVLPNLDEAIPLPITAAAFNLVQELYQQMEQNNGLFSYVPTWLLEDSEEMGDLLLAANYLDVTFQNKEHNFDAFVKALYVAWLNADVTRAIVVRQTVAQACQQMGIDNVLAEWAQLIVDVSDCLDQNQIRSLNTRSNSISWLVRTGQMPAVNNGILYLSNRNLTVCDAWNIPNLGQITRLNLSGNHITDLPVDVFNGLNALKELELDQNRLATLEAGVFAGLDALEKLYLSRNQLITLKAGTFNGLGALKELYLNRNQLRAIPVGIFTGLRSLEILGLLYNPLSQISIFQLPLSYIMPWLFLDSNDQFGLDVIKRRRPQWFAPPYEVPTQAIASAGDQQDDAVCTQCNQIGNACNCSADAAS